MAVSYNFAGPRIVKDGLVLYLDAGNPNSYNLRTPNTWRDISRRGNNGSLINGPVFSSANGGSIVFDGTNDYVSIGNAQTYFPGPVISGAIDVWIKPGVVNASDIYLGLQNPVNNRVYIGNYFGLWDVGFGDFAWNGGFGGTRSNVTLSWTHLCLSITSGSAKLYVNTIETITKTTDTTVSPTGIFPIGAYLFQGNLDGGVMGPSNVSNIKIYNRALSQAEITQNFNATRGRFGI